MKTLLIACFAVLISRSAAESEDLTRLRDEWKTARERVLDPVDRKYLAALETLKARLTKAGDLDGALEVDTELKKAQAASMGGFKGRLVPQLLTSGEWRFDVKEPKYTTHLSFSPQGEVFERGKEGAIGKWTIKGKALRMDFKSTWNEFGIEYDGAPVLVENRSDSGKREGVTLTHIE